MDVIIFFIIIILMPRETIYNSFCQRVFPRLNMLLLLLLLSLLLLSKEFLTPCVRLSL